MAVTQQMRTDWGNYWNGSKAGDIQAWGNGFLERNADGTATYKSRGGDAVNFNAGMSIEDFAKSSKEIGNVLYNNYGYKPAEIAQSPIPTISTVAPTPTISTVAPTAVTGAVNDSMLVEKRLNGLLSADSPLIQQARAKAAQVANSRGLLNSALAAGMGEEAAISQALPIATTDANTFFRQAVANQEAQNSANIASAAAANNAAIATANLTAQAQRDRENNQALTERMERQGVLDSQALDKKLAVEKTNALTSFQTAYIDKSLAAQSWMTDRVAAIQSTNGTAEEKQAAIAGVQSMASSLQTSINAVYSKVPGWSQEWLAVAQQGG